MGNLGRGRVPEEIRRRVEDHARLREERDLSDVADSFHGLRDISVNVTADISEFQRAVGDLSKAFGMSVQQAGRQLQGAIDRMSQPVATPPEIRVTAEQAQKYLAHRGKDDQ